MSAGNRVLLMIISFLLSLILWVYVQDQVNPYRPPPNFYAVAVDLRNLDTSKYIAVQQPDPIRIFPRGIPTELAQIDPKDLRAWIDVSKPVIGLHAYPVHVSTGGSVFRYDTPSSTVSVDIERKVTKQVPVVVQPANQLSNPDFQYIPKSTYTDPPTITVTGPEPAVSAVESATAILNLATAQPGRSQPSESVYLVGANFRQATNNVDYEPKKVTIYPGVAVGLWTKTVLVQPTYKGHVPPGFDVKEITVTPVQIEVRAQPDILSGLNFVRTQPVDLSQLNHSVTLTTSADLPPDVILSPPEPIVIKITVQPTAIATKTASPPDKTTAPKKRRRP